MIAALPITADSGRPPAMLFATVIRSGSTPAVFDREHPAGTAEAGLDFIGDEQDAVLLAARLERAQKFRRCDVEAAFA